MTAKALPDWPRMLPREWASAYCGLPRVEFERQIDAGELPAPVQIGNRKVWSRTAIDQALDRITGEGAPDWRRDAKLYE